MRSATLMRRLRAGVRQQAAELLAADAEQEIGRPDAGIHQTDEAGQHVVAAGVSEAVVQRLEMVEIEEQQRQRRAFVAVALQQPLAARHEGAAVERAGQRIGLRLGALLELEPLLRHRHDQHGEQQRVREHEQVERAQHARLHRQHAERKRHHAHQRNSRREEQRQRRRR